MSSMLFDDKDSWRRGSLGEVIGVCGNKERSDTLGVTSSRLCDDEDGSRGEIGGDNHQGVESRGEMGGDITRAWSWRREM